MNFFAEYKVKFKVMRNGEDLKVRRKVFFFLLIFSPENLINIKIKNFPPENSLNIKKLFPSIFLYKFIGEIVRMTTQSFLMILKTH